MFHKHPISFMNLLLLHRHPLHLKLEDFLLLRDKFKQYFLWFKRISSIYVLSTGSGETRKVLQTCLLNLNGSQVIRRRCLRVGKTRLGSIQRSHALFVLCRRHCGLSFF
ncbi:hypothetical protein PV11_08585 [Exophiala sideris]|uniref:Uncharacterized protein n=1 Tax=Exophiala sideris TaxID=1016849 RepID=A0A0D1Z2P1_9EURO|nr:hypothetical protein PV11_08585 [Exophiala sideris]